MKHVTFSIAMAAALTFVGCDGRTAKPLCADQNGVIEGISGVYHLNARNPETFEVQTIKLRAIPEEKGSVRFERLDNKEDLEIQVCNVNGAYILETEDKENGVFSASRLYTSQVGLHMSELLYDKVALDAAGVPNKVIEVPESVRKIFGNMLSDTIQSTLERAFENSDLRAIYVDNTSVPTHKLLQFAKPSSGGITWFRQ